MEWLVWIAIFSLLVFVVRRQERIYKDIKSINSYLESTRARQSQLPMHTISGDRTLPIMDGKARTSVRDTDDLPRKGRIKSAMKVKNNG